MVEMKCLNCQKTKIYRGIVEAGQDGWTIISGSYTMGEPMTISGKLMACQKKECKGKLVEKIKGMVMQDG